MVHEVKTQNQGKYKNIPSFEKENEKSMCFAYCIFMY